MLIISGWVSSVCLTRGNEQREPLPIEIFTNQNRPAPVQTATVPGENVSGVRRALRNIWSGIRGNRQQILDVLPGLSPNGQDDLFGPDSAYYGDQVCNCTFGQGLSVHFTNFFQACYPKLTKFYQRTDPLFRTFSRWTPSQMLGQSVAVAVSTSSSTKDFGDKTVGNATYTVAVYVGQTKVFQQRNRQHLNKVGGENSNHYRLADKAGQHRWMIPLIIISGSLDDSFLDIAELSIVCLFNSWFPPLMERTNVKLHGTYTIDFEAAAVLSAVAKAAIEGSNWGVPSMYGLNWNTPVVRNSSTTQKWVSWYDNTRSMWIYQSRKSLVASSNASQIKIGGWQSLGISRELTQQAGFSNGQKVTLVAELSTDNEPHPFRFVRLPAIGRNPELEELMALALKLVWFNSEQNQWWTTYLCRYQLGHKTTENPEVLSVFQVAMAIYMDLKQIGYIGAPDWLRTRPHVDVKQLTYDHLGQKLQAVKVQHVERTWPQDHTIAHNGQRLRTKFPAASFPNVAIGSKPASMRATQKCDMCLSRRGVCS